MSSYFERSGTFPWTIFFVDFVMPDGTVLIELQMKIFSQMFEVIIEKTY